MAIKKGNVNFIDPETLVISESTVKQYISKAKQLYKKATKELEISGITQLDYRQFVIWFLDNRINLHKNSYRVYKNAILYYLVYEVKTTEALKAANHLVRFMSDLSYVKSDKTSAKKLKRIPKEDLGKMLDYLDKDDNKWNPYIKHWLLSGILCGLRPIEWKNAEIINYNDQIALKVKNAKHTNGRSNGEFRIILLTSLNGEELSLIKQQIYNVRNFDKIGQYERFYNDCVKQLHKINTTLFRNKKKHITLYSARHQFSANAKSSNKTRSEIAALMGHSVDKTATLYYGKGRFGNKSLKVTPVKEQVATVKKTENSYNPNYWAEKLKQNRLDLEEQS